MDRVVRFVAGAFDDLGTRQLPDKNPSARALKAPQHKTKLLPTNLLKSLPLRRELNPRVRSGKKRFARMFQFTVKQQKMS